jgi:septal ring factor EnvC (AmiA/AmiB activator)
MRCVCVLLALVCVLSARVTTAQQGVELAGKLEKIRFGVAEHEGEIARIRAEFNGLLKQRKEIEVAIGKLKQQEKSLLAKVEQLARERGALATKVQAAEARVSEQQVKSTRRLRALYMSSAPHMARSYLWRAGGIDMEKTAVYVRSVRSADEARFAGVKEAVQQLNDRRAEMERSYSEQKSAQDAATAARTNAEAQAAKLKVLGDQLSQKRKNAETSLLKLRQEAEKLEALMAAIMSVDTTGPSAPEEGLIETPGVSEAKTPREEPTVRTPEPSDVQVVPATIQLVPGGLFASTIRISAPVKGKVVQKFGKVKVTDFADMIFSKGLEFSAEVGSEVLAVQAGKVAFVGTLPGYETVVVVDHGSRSYSLYGRLGKSVVRSGQMLVQEQSVGVTGEPDAKGRNFYFEVRKNGTPVDPERILRKVSR